MVLAQHRWCTKCDRDTMHHNNKCVPCQEIRRREERVIWLALTPEEKIERLLKRIEDLEKRLYHSTY